MNESSFATATAWSYGLALGLYVALMVRMALGWRRGARAALLLLAVAATAVWAGVSILAGLRFSGPAMVALDAADSLRYGIWFAFVASLLRGATQTEAPPRNADRPLPRWMVTGLCPPPVTYLRPSV